MTFKTRCKSVISSARWGIASLCLAGGGLRMGQVVGATNSKAEFPAERPLSPQDLLATIYHHLRLNHRHEFLDYSGRPIPILSHGDPIRELV